MVTDVWTRTIWLKPAGFSELDPQKVIHFSQRGLAGNQGLSPPKSLHWNIPPQILRGIEEPEVIVMEPTVLPHLSWHGPFVGARRVAIAL